MAKLCCFHYAVTLKAIICWVFAIAAVVKPEFMIKFFFALEDGASWGESDLLMTQWFGKYIGDLGIALFLGVLFVTDKTNQKRFALGVALTQFIGLCYCGRWLPNLLAQKPPFNSMRILAYVIPVGYFFLICMFVGVYLCNCKKCCKGKCKEEEEEKDK